MLLYNQRKEFIGIDEDDLNALNFKNINELQNESHDFADLFVKKPGYIHNFKNFSWIDFILHSESDESKAIIHAKGKNYSCSIHITPFHFTSEESGYAIIIKNLRALKGSEDTQASKDLQAAGGIQASPAPSAPLSTPPPLNTPPPTHLEQNTPELDISLDDIRLSEEAPQSLTEEAELPSFEQSHTQELNEPDPLEVPETQEIDLSLASSGENEFGAPVDIDYNAPLTLDDDVMKDGYEEPLHEEEPLSTETFAVEEDLEQEQPMLGDYVSSDENEHLSELVTSGEYRYDPNVAANELGLPVDLIEEFIGDFIDQAHEFHDDLYASVQGGDFDNIQILSHKLKGVAANLRVEDAFDVLSVVNTSKEVEEITPNLNEFYKIIAKLEGKELPEPVKEEVPVPQAEPAQEAPLPVEEADEYNIGIKQPDDGPLLIDEEVPQAPEDDIYGDLLADPDQMPEPETPSPDVLAPEEDIYDDLLSTPESTEPGLQETDDSFQNIDDSFEEAQPSFQEDTVAPAHNDEIYDDLLGVPKTDLASQPQSTPSVDSPVLNFDAQSSANELGVPLEIVQEFIQDFKGQVEAHTIDFTNALEHQDIHQVNKTATLLKGMSDNLRLNEISEVLKGLQAEKDINNTAEALASLQAYANQL